MPFGIMPLNRTPILLNGSYPPQLIHHNISQPQLRLQLCAVCHNRPRAIDLQNPGEFHPTCSPECGRIFRTERMCIVCRNSPRTITYLGKKLPTCSRNCGKIYKNAIKCSHPGCRHPRVFRVNRNGNYNVSSYCFNH
jgi:hypothetical protein